MNTLKGRESESRDPDHPTDSAGIGANLQPQSETRIESFQQIPDRQPGQPSEYRAGNGQRVIPQAARQRPFTHLVQ